MESSLNRSKYFKTIVLTLTALVITACANTRPVMEWNNEGFTGRLNNILVIGVTSKSKRRHKFEDKFVAELADWNVNAIPSYELIDSSMYLSRKVVENAIKGQGMGAVIVMRLASIKEKEVYRQPDNQDENMTYFNYYDKAFQQSNSGSYEQHKIVALETNLYDTQSGELVWSMQSETMETSQSSQIVEAHIELTIKTLAKRGLI